MSEHKTEVVAVTPEDAKVDAARTAAAEATKKLSKAELDSLHAQATINNNRDPVEEEKRNNRIMFARDQFRNTVGIEKLADVQGALDKKRKEVEDKQKEVAAINADIAALAKAETALKTVGEVDVDPLIEEAGVKIKK